MSWLQIIDVQPHAKATVASAGFQGEEDMAGMPVEALLGMDMAHPNVVQTYRHTSLPTAVSYPAAHTYIHLHSIACTAAEHVSHCWLPQDALCPDALCPAFMTNFLV